VNPELLAKVNNIVSWAALLQTRSAEVRAQMDALCKEALGKMNVVEELEAEAQQITDPDTRDKFLAAVTNLKDGICAVAGAMANVPQAA
jgi:FtsZ-binding cell division protein ZapB